MYMRSGLVFLMLVCVVMPVQAEPETPHLGKPATKALVAHWNSDIFPNGDGLPKGRGTVQQGQRIYQDYCEHCHGAEGQGGSADELAGARHGLTDNPPDKTIGTYWPYATTVFDFIRRAMPLDNPGILNDNQVYAVSAYLLYLNDLLKSDDSLSAQTLATLKMPNRNGFVTEYSDTNTNRNIE